MDMLSRKRIFSMYLVFLLCCMGFSGILVINGVNDNYVVSASSVLYVGGSGPSNYTSIQAAIDNATAGDTIYVWDGVYIENFTINKTLSLIGNGTSKTFINGNGSVNVVTITASWTNITGFSINGSGSAFKNAGIWVETANNVHVYNVNCSNNNYGMVFNSSDYCTIENNNASSNSYNGIGLFYSENNTIKLNSIHYNGYSGIELLNSNTNLVFENNCSYNDNGIEMGFANFNSIYKNSCTYNWVWGFCIWDSDKNLIENNIASNNYYEGIYLSWWYYNGPRYNKVTNNTCNGNGYSGIDLEYAKENLVENNTCNYNDEGIISYETNTIINNFCNYNNYGITTYDMYPMVIKNNQCNYNNYDGIAIYSGYSIEIADNVCNYNNVGISVWDNHNNFTRNTCDSNDEYGIFISRADYNSFRFNNISNNPIGIRMENNNGFNIFKENNITFNTNVGFFIESGSFNNDIYYNIFDSNAIQAKDNATSNWGKVDGGNYWTDYTGLDNGAAGRIPGDGIGDTNIPHPGPGLDNYPFLKKYDWKYPAKPGLVLKSDLDPDGNYGVFWYNSDRATGYLVQEDENIDFTSPSEYTKGWMVQIDMNVLQISDKAEGKYYYRAKAYNDLGESAWSEIVNVTVNLEPLVPTNLMVTAIPEGNALELDWDLNTGDTVQYGLHYMNKTKWELLSNVTHPLNSYLHSDLIDGKVYSYKICAIDVMGQVSEFSNIITGVPKDSIPPSAPTGLTAMALSNTEIELKWDANTDLDLTGYDIYMQSSEDDPGDTFGLIYKLVGENTSHIVTNLTEEVTYYFKIKAFDEAPNNSSFSNLATATTPDQTPPDPPKIIKVFNATIDSLTITWEVDPLSDVVGYFLNRSLNTSGPYEPVNEVPIKQKLYIDTGLKEDTTYYYIIRGIDEVNLLSQYSDYASGKTLFGEKPPEVNNPLVDFEIAEDSYDDSSINLLVCFRDLNHDELSFRYDGNEHINITVFQKNGTVILEPELNWNGGETITFFASDGTSEISDSVTITVTSVNDPPDRPTIVKPENGTIIKEGEFLDLVGTCSDPDLQYGDHLSYQWSSTIDGDLGTGASMIGVLLSAGNHSIILIVTDDSDVRSFSSVKIIVTAKPTTTDSDDGGLFSSLIMWVILVIVIIIILVIIFFIFLKKKKSKNGPWVEEKSEQAIEDLKESIEMPGKPAGKGPQTAPGGIDHVVEEPKRELCSSCGLEMYYDKDIESYQCRYCDVWEEE